LAWAAYQRGAVDPGRLAATFPLSVIDVLARRRYGLDGLYAGLYRGFILGLSRLIGWIDRYLVDGVLNFVSASTLRGGDLLRRIPPHHVPVAPPPARGAADRRRDDRRLDDRFPLDLRRLRPRGGGLPVLREAAARAAARHLLRARRRRDQPAPGAADVGDHLRRRLRVVDDRRPQPGVLRAVADARHRRLRRLRHARPLRLLPLLRARRAADVVADRCLWLERRDPPAWHLCLGVPGGR